MKSKKQTAKLDILNGSIWNKIPLYALPVAATGILEILPAQTVLLPLLR